MKIIFGLGNPGKKYERTRHNLGWRVIDRLAEEFGPPGSAAPFKKKLEAACLTLILPDSNETVILAKPLTYMNNSGRAVKNIVSFYREPLSNILIICDDFQLPLGKIRIRPTGSDGGHNGLASAIQSLQTENFPRLRVGIAPAGGPGALNFEPAEFVLGNFNRSEEQAIKKSLPDALAAVSCWLTKGIEKCMNRFN